MQKDTMQRHPEPETKETPKKPRKVSVKNPSFFLYKRYDGTESEDLSPMGSFGTEVDLRNAIEETLDAGTLERELVVFKGRFLKFEVKETKRRIRVV